MISHRLLLVELLAAVVGLRTSQAAVTIESRDGEIVMLGGSYALAFSATNGSILRVTMGAGGSVCASAAPGLWQAFFSGGGTLKASVFKSGTGTSRFLWSTDSPSGPLRLDYTNAQIATTVLVAGRDDGVEFVAMVRPKLQTLTEFSLPGRLRFAPESVNRFVGALNANESVGAAFRADFFKSQSQDSPAGWETRVVGSSGYVSLFGGPLVSRPDGDPATAITITTAGRTWLGAALADQLDGAAAVVNRPSTRSQAGLVIADSANGPYYCGSQLGGEGWLFRLGGNVAEGQKALAQDLVLGTIVHLAATRPAGRVKVGLLAMDRGPQSGGWASVTVGEWRERLRGSSALAAAGGEVEELHTARELMTALAATNHLALVNPYGEWTPVLEESGMSATVAAVGAYVKAGGCWFETGGYPFYYELRPTHYFTYETLYPPAFADFLHLDTTNGTVSWYGVQPQEHAPWAGATNTAAIFVPGRLTWGGDAQGGYGERRFATYVAAGIDWQSPAVRLVLGPNAAEALAGYAQANAFNRRLDRKMSTDTLTRLKQSVLVYYSGTCAEKLAHLEQVPSPALIHFADYLKGGFDKEYPDHLPPNATFGTLAALQDFVGRCQELGHLVMPYTNPTWWCDHPRGPTFLREGEAPLLRKLDAALSYENYGGNDGYTVCHWHPAVRAANRVTVDQFTEQVPIDVLFQDQCGARTWQYDLNPASPAVWAYADGLISTVAEDCLTKPLATENGWDRIANYESMFCGMTWAIVPTKNPPDWRWFLADRFPASTWDLFPLAQLLAHDKVAMVHHDLGQFVTDDEVLAWTLGLGYGLSARVDAHALELATSREWLRWLDRLQKSVVARYVGEPVAGFVHDHDGSPAAGDGGAIRAIYGPVTIEANLGPDPRPGGGYELAGNGFRATAPGLVAAHLARLGTNRFDGSGTAFVTAGSAREYEFWVFSAGDRQVAIELPEPVTGPVEVRLDGDGAQEVRAQDGIVSLALGFTPGGSRPQPPADLAGLPPRDWPGGKPAIGVLNFSGMPRAWTTIAAADWLQALSSSRLASEFGAPIRSITSYDALVAALQVGPTTWLAIVNPAGEIFPTASAGQWPTALGLIRDYVNRGGSWWETAGYSFYTAAYWSGSAWQTESVGPSGVAFLGVPVGDGDVTQAAETLTVTARGWELLGETLAGTLQGLSSVVNRGLPRTTDDPGHLALLAGAGADFLGGYRLAGWGFLWRIGGFNPNRQAALPAAVGVLEYQYAHAPIPVNASPVSYLWHGTVTRTGGAAFRRVAVENGQLAMAIAECPAGATNYLERSAEVDGSSGWETVFMFASPPGETNWLDAEGFVGTRRFYRVKSMSGL